MKSLLRAVFATLLTLATPAAAIAQDSSYIKVPNEDQEMNEAKDKARASLSHFWQKFGDPGANETGFAIKVALPYGRNLSTSGPRTSSARTGKSPPSSTMSRATSRRSASASASRFQKHKSQTGCTCARVRSSATTQCGRCSSACRPRTPHATAPCLPIPDPI